MKKLYVIVFNKTGEILTPEAFQQFWKNYGGNGLAGWRPPKKIYYTLSKAKNGFRYIPEEIKPHVSIAEFSISEKVVDGTKLQQEQAERKVKRDILRANQILKNRSLHLQAEQQRIERELAAAQRSLALLNETKKTKS